MFPSPRYFSSYKALLQPASYLSVIWTLAKPIVQNMILKSERQKGRQEGCLGKAGAGSGSPRIHRRGECGTQDSRERAVHCLSEYTLVQGIFSGLTRSAPKTRLSICVSACLLVWALQGDFIPPLSLCPCLHVCVSRVYPLQCYKEEFQ